MQAFAKVWTGYKRQALRSNIQTMFNRDTGPNLIDPLKLDPMERDRFPKTKLNGGKRNRGGV